MCCHSIGWCIGKCPLYRGVLYSECPLSEVPLYIVRVSFIYCRHTLSIIVHFRDIVLSSASNHIPVYTLVFFHRWSNFAEDTAMFPVGLQQEQ